jgi:transposase
MWSQENHPKYNRDKLQYPSDITDEECSFIEHLSPPAKHRGPQRSVNIREIVNGLMYILGTGRHWRYIKMPKAITLCIWLFALIT